MAGLLRHENSELLTSKLDLVNETSYLDLTLIRRVGATKKIRRFISTVGNFSKSYFRKCPNYRKSKIPGISEVIILRNLSKINILYLYYVISRFRRMAFSSKDTEPNLTKFGSRKVPPLVAGSSVSSSLMCLPLSIFWRITICYWYP